MRDSRDEMMRRCIQDCETCHALCVRTLEHCLQRGGEFSAHDHVTVLLDCIQICDVSRDFMLRNSPRHRLTCGSCAEICDVRESLSHFRGSRYSAPCPRRPRIRPAACRVWPQSFVARRSPGPPNVAEIPMPRPHRSQRRRGRGLPETCQETQSSSSS